MQSLRFIVVVALKYKKMSSKKPNDNEYLLYVKSATYVVEMNLIGTQYYVILYLKFQQNRQLARKAEENRMKKVLVTLAFFLMVVRTSVIFGNNVACTVSRLSKSLSRKQLLRQAFLMPWTIQAPNCGDCIVVYYSPLFLCSGLQIRGCCSYLTREPSKSVGLCFFKMKQGQPSATINWLCFVGRQMLPLTDSYYFSYYLQRLLLGAIISLHWIKTTIHLNPMYLLATFFSIFELEA